jgi:hypothetical protein
MAPGARTLLLAALLAACASKVQVRGGKGDPNYDFSRLRTYAWLPREPTGDPRIDEDLLEERVRSGVDEQLGDKGFRLAPEGEADFVVGYRAVLGRQRSVEAGKGYKSIWTDEHGRGTDPAAVDKVVYEGTLVLRVFDGKGRELVWEATAETEINPRRSPLSASREDRVRIAIREMLDRFPP